jgi:hypothetical protein
VTSAAGPPRRPSGRGLLSYADQVRLAKAMEAGRDDERLRLEAAVERGEDARRELIEAHAPLVLTEAQRYTAGDRSTLVELVQQGNSGLVQAVDTFDWRRGVRLSAYASGWIRFAIAADRPDLPEPESLLPDPVVVGLYRDRVASLDAGPQGLRGRRRRRAVEGTDRAGRVPLAVLDGGRPAVGGLTGPGGLPRRAAGGPQGLSPGGEVGFSRPG